MLNKGIMAEAYLSLIELAENCADEALKRRYDDILIALSVEFHTLQESKDYYSTSQRNMFYNYEPCGEYVATRRDYYGNIVCYPMLKYKRRD